MSRSELAGSGLPTARHRQVRAKGRELLLPGTTVKEIAHRDEFHKFVRPADCLLKRETLTHSTQANDATRAGFSHLMISQPKIKVEGVFFN